MKRILSLVAACILSGATSFAASRYWIGPVNGNWSNPANWSAESDGTGGASVPGIDDDVFFERDAVVQLDAAPSVLSLSVSISRNVTIFTASATSLTIAGSLQLAPGSVLTDSTTQAVAFPVIFDSSKGATGEIYGFWNFAGNVAATGSSSAGPSFEAVGNAKVNIYGRVFSSGEGRIVSRQNAGIINSSASTLAFMAGSYFVSENNTDVFVPDATWDKSSTVLFSGNAARISHLASLPSYGFLTADLSNLTMDAGLSLPNGTEIKNLISITNTNGYTLTLLAASSPENKVEVITRGALSIAGPQTRVAMAKATSAAPQTAYQLAVSLDFLQSGGNFSLQDFDNVTGSSTLIVGRDLKETAGTFMTKSTATGTASFVVDMDFNYGGVLRYDADQVIKMASETIDNVQHNVTLRLDSKTDYTGVTLQSPLSVGKAEFLGGPITTTATNILTISNTDPLTAVKTGIRNGYVNGPVNITTNSTGYYTLPTGKNSTKMSPAFLIPTSSALSVYKAEYFRSGYSDLTTIANPLSGISKDKYWNIEKVSGSDASVQLTLNGSIDGAKNNDGIVVAHYTGGKWIAEQGGFLTPGTLAAGTVSSRPLTSYSAFTLGYVSFLGSALAVKIVSFEAVKYNSGASIDWKAEEIPASFEVQRSLDGRNFSAIGTVAGISTKTQYTFIDPSIPQGYIYYRLRSLEKDGTSSYSKVAIIINQEQVISITAMAPTVVSSQAKLFINAAKAGKVDFLVTDMLGRNCKQMQVAVAAGSSETNLDLSSLRAGLYQVNGMMNGTATSVVRFVKN